MTAASLPSGAAVAAELADQPGFLEMLFGEQEGYLELCFIAGDPRDKGEAGHLKRDAWYLWPQQQPIILRRINELAAAYGDVYVSSTCYRRPIRSRHYSLPSCVVFVDDAPTRPALPYSGTVSTSKDSRHAYYRTTEPLDPATRYDLSHRAARALGADASGADVEQVVRIPGTFNTKGALAAATAGTAFTPYAVQLVELTARTYTVAELQAQWAPLPRTTAAILDDQAVGRALTNIELLLDADNLPKRLSAHSKTRTTLANLSANSDRSKATWDAIGGFVMHGYPDDEIAALIIHFMLPLYQDKGSDWLYADVERTIGKWRREMPNVKAEPTRAYLAAQGMPLPTVPRRPRGRPEGMTPERYRTWLAARTDGAGGQVMLSQGAAAEALGVSIPTIQRLERQLREQGTIKRQVVRRGRESYSYVVVFSTIKNTDAPTSKSASVEPTSTNSPILVPSADPVRNSDVAQCNASNDAPSVPQGRTHPVEGLTEAPPPAVRLDEAMRAAIEAVAHEARVSKPRVRALFATYFPHLRWFDAVYARVMRRRQWEAPTSAAYFELLRTMTADELSRALKGIDGRIARYSRIFGTEPDAKPKGERQTLKQLQARRRLVQTELRRRARNVSPGPSRGCVLPSDGEHGPMVVVIAPEPVAPADPHLPLLPDGWAYVWTPSTSLHQATHPATGQRTRYYATPELAALVKEVRALSNGHAEVSA